MSKQARKVQMKLIESLASVIQNQWLAAVLLFFAGIFYMAHLIIKAKIDLEKNQFKTKNTIDEKVIGVLIDYLPNLSYLKDLSMMRSEFSLNHNDHAEIKIQLNHHLEILSEIKNKLGA